MGKLKGLLLTEGLHGMISQVEGLAKALDLEYFHEKVELNSFWNMFGRFFGRNCRPTCLFELTFQISNYLKKAEKIPKEHIPRCTRRTHHPF